jgi:hypothetical protein
MAPHYRPVFLMNCAWLLWAVTQSPNTSGDWVKTWALEGAAPTYRECDDRSIGHMRGRTEVLREKWAGRYRNVEFPAASVIIIDPFNGPRRIETMECLPDAVDPRK